MKLQIINEIIKLNVPYLWSKIRLKKNYNLVKNWITSLSEPIFILIINGTTSNRLVAMLKVQRNTPLGVYFFFFSGMLDSISCFYLSLYSEVSNPPGFCFPCTILHYLCSISSCMRPGSLTCSKSLTLQWQAKPLYHPPTWVKR